MKEIDWDFIYSQKYINKLTTIYLFIFFSSSSFYIFIHIYFRCPYNTHVRILILYVQCCLRVGGNIINIYVWTYRFLFCYSCIYTGIVFCFCFFFYYLSSLLSLLRSSHVHNPEGGDFICIWFCCANQKRRWMSLYYYGKLN